METTFSYWTKEIRPRGFEPSYDSLNSSIRFDENYKDKDGQWVNNSKVYSCEQNLGEYFGYLSLAEVNRALILKGIIRKTITYDDITPHFYKNGVLIEEAKYANLSKEDILPTLIEMYPERFI